MGRGVGFHLAGDVSGYLQLLGAMPCNYGWLHASRGEGTLARPDGLAGGSLADSMPEAGTMDHDAVQVRGCCFPMGEQMSGNPYCRHGIDAGCIVGSWTTPGVGPFHVMNETAILGTLTAQPTFQVSIGGSLCYAIP